MKAHGGREGSWRRVLVYLASVKSVVMDLYGSPDPPASTFRTAGTADLGNNPPVHLRCCWGLNLGLLVPAELHP